MGYGLAEGNQGEKQGGWRSARWDQGPSHTAGLGRSAEASGIQLLGRPLVSHWCSPCRSPQEQLPQPLPLGLSQGQLSLGNAGVAGSKWEGKPQSISHFICPDWQLQLTFPGSQEWLGGHAGTGQDSSAASTATH